MRKLVAFVVLALSIPAAAMSQTAADAAIEERLRALEATVRELREELAALRSAPAPPADRQATPTPSPIPESTPVPAPPPVTATAQAPSTRSAEPAGDAQAMNAAGNAKMLNPDIGVIGNFLGAAGHSGGGTDSVAPIPAFTLQESELSLQAIVDPYARADFFLAVGEEGIEVEEGFVTFPTVPGGLLVKAGKMRATFGRLNTFHNHTLPWVDRPLVMFNLLGGNTADPDTGIKDAGVSVSRIIPMGGLFVEATAEMYRGDSGALFSAANRTDVSTIAHLRGYGDLSESANVEIGGSYARGHNDEGSAYLTQLVGTDLTLRWRPLRRAIYHSFAGRAELVWSRREQPSGLQSAFGGFVSADYRLNRRWFIGGRLDWSDRAREASVRDRGVSLVGTFWPSEFTQVRGQYRRMRYGQSDAVDEFLFQALFTIGAHGAHPF